MKLFGPNSPTALIAEDDDSGPGLNPRIARALSSGEYLVQIRHYQRRVRHRRLHDRRPQVGGPTVTKH